MNVLRKSIYIWGAGRQLETVYEAIKQEKALVKGIIDNNVNLQGKEWKDHISIALPDILLKEPFDYILVSVKKCEDIYMSCIDLGIDKEMISCFWNDDNLGNILDYNIRKISQLEAMVYNYQTRWENLIYEIVDTRLDLKLPIIKKTDELIDYILAQSCSLCRFGDGELELMRGKECSWFQHEYNNIRNRLNEVFYSDKKEVMIAVADIYGNLEKYTEEAADGFRAYLKGDTRCEVVNLLGTERVYYDAFISRPYIIYKDKAEAEYRFRRLKLLWQNRDVLIIEGKYSRLGVGNDLLDGSKSIRRILCPQQDAFLRYSSILDCAQSEAKENDLVLISLGAAATILAYDIALSGIQALDIGQVDNEYDWFLRKTDRRVCIEGKMTAEYSKVGYRLDMLHDEKYKQQIVAQIE